MKITPSEMQVAPSLSIGHALAHYLALSCQCIISVRENLTARSACTFLFSKRQWCCREVIQCKVFTDHVQMTALATALGVPLRVEYLLQGAGQDLYTGQEDTHDDTPRSTCWPRCRPRRHQVPRGHVVPCVTGALHERSLRHHLPPLS
jgi:hypothetical protein